MDFQSGFSFESKLHPDKHLIHSVSSSTKKQSFLLNSEKKEMHYL